MAIVFPASPSVNDTFTAGSITYKWDGDKWIGLGVTPADRLVEGSNSLEINANNDLVWSGDSVLLGTATANVNDRLTIHDPGSAFMSIRSDVASDGNSQVLDFGVGTADRSSSNLTAVIAADIHSTSGGTLKADLVFQTNAGNNISDKMRLTSDGNLGINRTDPDQRLNVNGNIEVNAYDNTGGGGGYTTSSGLIIGNLYDAGKSYSGSDDRTACVWQERGLDLDIATNDTLRMKITYDGLVQIGTSTTSSFPDRLLSVGDITRDSSYIDIRSDVVGGLLFADGTSTDAAYRGQVDYNHNDDEMRLWTAANVRMRISSVGRIRFPNVPGVAGSNLANLQIESDGNLCTTTSIRAAKTNISPLADTSWLFDLNPVTFNWRTKTENEDGTLTWGEEADGGTQYGLIAEEVEEVKDDFCYYNNDGELSGVHYDRLVAPLLKVVQQQKEEIEALKARLDAAGL